MKDSIPKYATLLYDVRKTLDISIAEYFYLDMVWHLSHSGWCYKSLESVAEDMGISKNGVIKMRDRLIKRGLLKKSVKGYVKTTEMYHKVVQHEKNDEKLYHKVDKMYHKVVRSVPLSSTKNNNRITKNNKTESEKYFDKFYPTRPEHMPTLY